MFIESRPGHDDDEEEEDETIIDLSRADVLSLFLYRNLNSSSMMKEVGAHISRHFETSKQLGSFLRIELSSLFPPNTHTHIFLSK